jgi:cadmium resistance protein CadD (predicted permease)
MTPQSEFVTLDLFWKVVGAIGACLAGLLGLILPFVGIKQALKDHAENDEKTSQQLIQGQHDIRTLLETFILQQTKRP